MAQVIFALGYSGRWVFTVVWDLLATEIFRVNSFPVRYLCHGIKSCILVEMEPSSIIFLTHSYHLLSFPPGKTGASSSRSSRPHFQP